MIHRKLHFQRFLWALSFAALSLFILSLMSAQGRQTYLEASRWGQVQQTATPAKAGTPAALLNLDGTIRAGQQGSFDVSGYRLEYTASGAPRFVLAGAAQTGCNGWDTRFSLANGTNGEIRAVAVSGSAVYVGGYFSIAGGLAANHVAKFDTTTGAWSTLGNGTGNGVNNLVRALAVLRSDLYVGWNFTQANIGGAAVTVNGVAKFNILTGTWSALDSGTGNGVNSNVNALLVSGNDLYVGGSFTQANAGGAPISAHRVAKFNTATGVWSALGTGGGNGVNNHVQSLALLGNDLYVGGSFLQANFGGASISVRYVARCNTTTGVWNTVGPGTDNGVSSDVMALAVIGSDLYAGGFFTMANVGGAGVFTNFVARFSTTTNTWSALGSGIGDGVNTVVRALAVSENDLYVSGLFTQANVGGAPISANRVAKFNTVTGTWSALGTGAGNGVDDDVYALAVSGNEIYVGGIFNLANAGSSAVGANRVAQFNTSTNLWSAVGTGAGGMNAPVQVVLVSGSAVYVGGSFVSAGNVAANRVAKFDIITGVWSALGSGGGSGVNDTVSALAIMGDDLYVGGIFTQANVGGAPVNANHLAKFNLTTSTWSAVGSGAGNGVQYATHALAVLGSDLYVGGLFDAVNIGGTTISANNVAKFNTTTNTWSPLGSNSSNGVDIGVNALKVVGNDLYVGGAFDRANLGGPLVNANGVAKFDTLTNTWSALGSGDGNGVTGEVYALAALGSDIYVGGYFSLANLGGTVITVSSIAKFNTITNTWSALGTGGGNGVNSTVFDLAVIGDHLYVGGEFTQANVYGTTVSANYVAEFDTSTSEWRALSDPGGGNGVNSAVYGLAVQDSDLYVGGSFLIAGDNKQSRRIGRFCTANNAAPTISSALISAIQSSPASLRQIATVSDLEDAEETLLVTATPAIGSGVTISNIVVNAAGNVTASVAASCAATTSTFTLMVTDSQGAMATATLTVNVVANPAPNVGSYPNTVVAPGGTTTVTPSAAPADNGSIESVTATASPATFTGSLTANPATGAVTITNANPMHSFLITVTVTDDCGATTTRGFTLTVSEYGTGLMFYPLPAPVRLLDTRPGASPNACSQPNAPIAGGSSRLQPARNSCGIPANAQAITGNITSVQSSGGFLTLYPTGGVRPTVASTNYTPNDIVNNVFTVALGNQDGAFNIFALSTSEVVVDVTGYYAPPGPGGLYFHTLPAPVRLLETRLGEPVGCVKPGAPLAAGADSLQTATTACTGIPAAARAIVGNATTVSPQGPGYLTLFPADTARPLIASSNYVTNQVVNGPFTTGLSAAGQFKVSTLATTELVIDVLGYYSAEANDANGAGLLYTPLAQPVRLLETRAGQPVGCYKPGQPLTGQQSYAQAVRGLCDGQTIPATALAVVGNATVVFPAADGYLTLWPASAVQPTVATVNYQGGEIVNRHFIVGLGNADGAFKMFSFATTELVIDLAGYFAP